MTEPACRCPRGHAWLLSDGSCGECDDIEDARAEHEDYEAWLAEQSRKTDGVEVERPAHGERRAG